MSIRKCSVSTRSEEHTSELQSLRHLVCRLLLEKIISLVSRARTHPPGADAAQARALHARGLGDSGLRRRTTSVGPGHFHASFGVLVFFEERLPPVYPLSPPPGLLPP